VRGDAREGASRIATAFYFVAIRLAPSRASPGA